MMDQSQHLAITCNSLKAREESRLHGAIGFGLASHWCKNGLETFKRITKRSNLNHLITFDSHAKNALTIYLRPRHNNSDQGSVISASAFHALPQSISKVFGRIP